MFCDAGRRLQVLHPAHTAGQGSPVHTMRVHIPAILLVVLLLEGLFRSLFIDRVIGRIGRIQVLSSFASAIVPSELATKGLGRTT